MQLSLRLFKEFSKFYPQSKAWVESDEFKEKYIDTHHPYPPLLNPQNIDYESVSADLAWELNLPLPPNYDFVYISNGSAASAAMFYFLNECNIKFDVNYTDIDGPKENYIWYFNTFKQTKNDRNIFFAYCKDIVYDRDSPHLVNCISKKVPILYIARDPIEKIQHAINHTEKGADIFPKQNKCNITCAYTLFFKKNIYWGGCDKPSFKILEDLSNNLIINKLVCDSIFKSFTNISFVECIEFNDLKPDKAFDTFCELANKFGFDKPVNIEIFRNRINRTRGTLAFLPILIYIHPDDIEKYFKAGQAETRDMSSLDKESGFSIYITLPQYIEEQQKDFVDISSEIAQNFIIDGTQILIIIQKDELFQLKNNIELLNITKQYIKGYIDAINNNVLEIKKQFISESQILEYLRGNDEVRKNIKRILDSELNYIKTHHPDFIQKWKYYLEFEKMCAELDDKN